MANILVIDDEEDIRSILKEILELEGHSITTSESGKNINNNELPNFDLVITDIYMPDQDGIQIIMNVKRIVPDMKIIAISGGAFFGVDNTLKTAQLLGARYTINKPFDIDDVVQKVNTLVSAD